MDRSTLISSLADMRNFVVVPDEYYDKLWAGTDKKNRGHHKRARNKEYNAGEDKRFNKMFNYVSLKETGRDSCIRCLTYTIVANVAIHWMSVPSGEQMEKMLELAGYTSAEMNEYVTELVKDDIAPESLPSSRLAPTIYLLSRVMCDAITDPSEWRGARRKEPNPALERLQALAAYMKEAGLLNLEDEGDENTSYDEFVLRRAEYKAKIRSINAELTEAYTQVKKRTGQINEEIDKEYRRTKTNFQARKAKNPVAPLASPPSAVPTLPLTTAGLSNSAEGMLQDILPFMELNETTRAMQTLRKEITGNEAMSYEEMENLIARYRKKLPIESQKRVDALAEKEKSLRDEFLDIANAGEEMKPKLRQKLEEQVSSEYIPAIAESAFRAILSGEDEIFKLEIGDSVCIDLFEQTNVGVSVIPFVALEDEEEWDDKYPEMNGKLSLRIYDEDDLVQLPVDAVGGQDTIKIPVSSAIAKYSKRTTTSMLYVRKSIIKRFKDAGYSNRRARDFAIVQATLDSVNDMETNSGSFDSAELYSTITGAESVPNAELEAEKKARQAAERKLKQLQKEAQIARHEIHMLQKENERLRKQMSETEAEEDPEDLEDSTEEQEEINFPYRTKLKVVVYGGFEVFHKELTSLLPDIRIVEFASHVDVTPVRNADIVFLQTNKTSHSNYFAVKDACKSRDIPYIHLSYASAKRCAKTIVKEIQKEETRRAGGNTERQES